MRRATRQLTRRMMAGLLVLAILLVYTVPGHAVPMPHRHAAPHGHTLAATQDPAAAATGDHAHGPGPCKGSGMHDDGGCCSVAPCATMHGGLPATAAQAFAPRSGGAAPMPALATPEGIGVDPAPRPPRPIL